MVVSDLGISLACSVVAASRQLDCAGCAWVGAQCAANRAGPALVINL